MISICCITCVGFAMNLVIVHGILICSRFLISVCMFIVSKAFLILSATVRAGGAIWLNPFSTVLFNVCTAVTVECCVLLPVLRGCVWYVCCYVRKKALLQCLQLLRGGYGHVWGALVYVFVGFWDGDSQLPYV